MARRSVDAIPAARPLSAAEAVCVVLGFGLPATANNLVQSYHIHFDIRLGVLDSTAIGTPTVTVSAPDTSTPDALPFVEQAIPQTGDDRAKERSVETSWSFRLPAPDGGAPRDLAVLAAATGFMLLTRSRRRYAD